MCTRSIPTTLPYLKCVRAKLTLRAISIRIKHAPHKSSISFDTVAVPEYHTGKCAEWDPDCEEKHEHKHHGMLADLTRTLFNGTPDK